MQNHHHINLVLSTDAKPRLKWTPELHHRFEEAVNHLGGAHKATPKSLMRVMGITGLRLYHLKSHLQKFRLGKMQQSEANAQLKLEDLKQMQVKGGKLDVENSDVGQNHNTKERKKIWDVMEMQMEVEKRLQEQIEVQRHLQLRIEAQGKYLKRVLRKAEETIAGYGCCSEALEELSQLASMVSSGCESSCLSEQSSSVSEGDCKRLTMQESNENNQEEFRMVDLNDAATGSGSGSGSGSGFGSELIEFL
ncbi:myb family transcription factor PHL8-like [Cucurbita pepo subsp. pepo]|uniref:myb family transcription factor PHL8-like n=1 Tax=Cucurbita pepo subsp. pepo TaxID=3664 RepID=UPI000C9D9544|nr:myb family transcription factor PHL8-like [Cucurbita pepo subsp. pepo]